ncbi:MAG: heavy-metal-associated domain-containing protein [Actinomycetia bacterium]|nr:heavy-metal-associated domain-containing protein [Actinomycetes bacterium]
MGNTTVLRISGMHCEHCQAAAKNALEALPGVTKAKVNWKKGEARVKSSAALDEADVRAAVEALDFKLLEIA